MWANNVPCLALLAIAFVVLATRLSYLALIRDVGETAAKRLLPRSRVAWSIYILVLLALVTAASTPEPWQQIILFGLSALVLSAVSVTVIQTIFTRQRPHQVLLELEKYDKLPVTAIGISVLCGTVALGTFLIDETRHVDWLLVGVTFLTLAVLRLVQNKTPLVVTAEGFYRVGKVIAWDQIESFEWAFNDRAAILILGRKRHVPLLDTIVFRIAFSQKEALHQFLIKYIVAQPNVPSWPDFKDFAH